MMAFRREFIVALCNDPEWKKRLEKAQTWPEVEKVLTAFAKAKGFSIAKISFQGSSEGEAEYARAKLGV